MTCGDIRSRRLDCNQKQTPRAVTSGEQKPKTEPYSGRRGFSYLQKAILPHFTVKIKAKRSGLTVARQSHYSAKSQSSGGETGPKGATQNLKAGSKKFNAIAPMNFLYLALEL
jgi:hypothetical protein